jgi:hypothetical protein
MITKQQLEQLFGGKTIQIGNAVITPLVTMEVGGEEKEDNEECDCYKCKVRNHVEAKFKAKDATLDTVEECRLEMQATQIAHDALAKIGCFKSEAFEHAAKLAIELGYPNRASAFRMIGQVARKLEAVAHLLKEEEDANESR